LGNHGPRKPWEDVLAFYGPAGQIQSYSLSAVLSMGWWQRHRAFGTSDWDEKSIQFFDRFRNVAHFCIWLHWSDRWYAWTASDGKQVTIDDRLRRRWDRLARQFALERRGEHRWASACYEFLAIQRNPADRPIIERLLCSETFNASLQVRPFDATLDGPCVLQVWIESSTRRTGDRLLGIFERERERPATTFPTGFYTYLGCLKGTVSLPAAPTRCTGYLWVRLVPQGGRRPADEHPGAEHSARLDFCTYREVCALLDEEPGRKLRFGFYGVSPGEYRIKCVWDRERPFNDEHTATVLAKTGDVTNREMPRVTVEAGKTTTNVLIDCTSPADDTRPSAGH